MTIKSKNVSFKYGTNLVLNDISLNFKKGSLYGILGPNGSGKTTFLKILNGILKLKYGVVSINKKNIKNLSSREIARIIAFVHQSSPLNFSYSVREIIKMGRYSHIGRYSIESHEDREIIDEIIENFNLHEFANRNFNELSGGEQQKVIIARSIAQQSKILLLDEPTNHLDINYQIEFMEMLRQYIKEGKIVIIVLHDINLATQFCDKIVLLSEGRMKGFGNIEDIITKDNIKEVYNIEVAVRRNNVSNSVFITPLRTEILNSSPTNNNSKLKRVHVVGGGGSATKILPLLKKYDVSIGIVNVLDDDYILANELDYKIISEAPFSPISENSCNKLKTLLEKVDFIILTNVPFGKANLKNLEILIESNKKIFVYEETPIEERDFTGGIAQNIYNKIKNLEHTSTKNNLLEIIEKLK